MGLIKKVIKSILLNYWAKSDQLVYNYYLRYYENMSHFSKKNDSIIFHQLDLEGNINVVHPLLINYNLAFKLFNESKAVYSILENKLYCTISNISFEIQTPEEVFILHEIWVDGCYNFELPKTDAISVIDIGMNVGYASLFFASKSSVEKVYSFEPFSPTYKQGLENMNLNNLLSQKIITHNYGLADIDKTIDVEYSPEHRGRVGVWGTDLILEKINQKFTETLHLKPFNQIIKEIVSDNIESRFVIKIDCEGSEYDIFDSLDESIMDVVDVILMEWHLKGPKTLKEKLNKLGFKTLTFQPDSNKVGMLYAFK